MAGLRNYVFDLLKADPTLNALGYNTDSIFPAGAPDSPASTLQRFMVLRWGIQGASPGRDTLVRPHGLTVWAYDREPDYGAIDDALKRVCVLLLPLVGVFLTPGWLIGVVDNASSEDLYDPAYAAVTRNWAFTIIANES